MLPLRLSHHLVACQVCSEISNNKFPICCQPHFWSRLPQHALGDSLIYPDFKGYYSSQALPNVILSVYEQAKYLQDIVIDVRRGFVPFAGGKKLEREIVCHILEDAF